MKSRSLWRPFLHFLVLITVLTAVPVSAQGRSDRVRRCLVLGCDRAASLTDSILLVAWNTATGTSSAVQIPRDTYAAYTERDYRKINGAYRALGCEEYKKFLSRALGVRIDYYAAMDLDCVSVLVDAVGGVDLDVPMDMVYQDPEQGLNIDIPKGRQHLDGAAAESFVRFRSGYANADLGRMEAQRNFLRAFADKCASLDSGSLFRLFLLSAPHVRTDLPISEVLRLSGGGYCRDSGEIPIGTLPGEAVRGVSGAWYFVLNRASARECVNTYLMPPEPVSEESFDPDRVFERVENPDFYRIYNARP